MKKQDKKRYYAWFDGTMSGYSPVDDGMEQTTDKGFEQYFTNKRAAKKAVRDYLLERMNEYRDALKSLK